MSLKDTLRDLFTFSSGERKGVIALVLILIIISSINMILMKHHPVPVQSNYPGWMIDSGAYEEADNIVISAPDTFTEPITPGIESAEPKSIIDPNTASLEDLLLTGFSLRQARTILNYRAAGGKFRTRDDLKKIYVLTPEVLLAVEPYIRMGEGAEKQTRNITEVPATININTADSGLLEKLPGIGPVLARRIIRYRAILGGYYSPEQIREVYGISDSLFLVIRGRLSADTAGLRKINLNTSEEKEMARHPYLGKYTAAGILKYRIQVGMILNINELIVNGLIPKDRYDKLKYYISL